jgi:hypothetical protein
MDLHLMLAVLVALLLKGPLEGLIRLLGRSLMAVLAAALQAFVRQPVQALIRSRLYRDAAIEADLFQEMEKQ